jgi:tRNA threonylcarbamoyl adenosine modification protein (Sua5/YciO/YrdC/YwlC family)
MSAVHDCTTPEGLAAGVVAATEAVRAGGVVVLPTDTVYGVGCDAFDQTAVAALLRAKGRGREMPPPVLVPSRRTVDGLARDVPVYARALMERFWPGALTLVLQAQSSLRWDLGDTFGTVAVRMPDDPTALALLEAVGPMAVTSANRTGMPAATTVADAQSQLGEAVAVYLDAGPARGGAPSTIVDCTGTHPTTLRDGALAGPEIHAVVSAAQEAADAAAQAEALAVARSLQAGSTSGRAPRKGPRIAGSRRR